MSEETTYVTRDWQSFCELHAIGEFCLIEEDSPDIYVSSAKTIHIEPPQILMHCKDATCNGRIRHSCESFYLQNEKIEYFFLEYNCRACNSRHLIPCMGGIHQGRLYLKKLGQEPPMGGPLPNALLRLSEGKEKEWIERGRSCIRQGHGIAALAYYRLVVEGIVDDLLDKMTKYCDTDDQRELIREAIVKPRLGDKLQAVKECIPKQLMLGLGQNPITFLYSCFSDELHYDTADDAKALEKAIHGMNIVCALLELMQDQDRLGQALKASFKALSDQHSQRKPKDRPS